MASPLSHSMGLPPKYERNIRFPSVLLPPSFPPLAGPLQLEHTSLLQDFSVVNHGREEDPYLHLCAKGPPVPERREWQSAIFGLKGESGMHHSAQAGETYVSSGN